MAEGVETPQRAQLLAEQGQRMRQRLIFAEAEGIFALNVPCSLAFTGAPDAGV